MTERGRTWRVGPLDDAAGDGVRDPLRLLAGALVAWPEDETSPFLCAHAADMRAMALRRRRPMLGERTSALEHDVRWVERLVEERRDGAFEARGRAEIARAVPDEPPVIAVGRKPGAHADVDSEKGRQPSAIGTEVTLVLETPIASRTSPE